MTITALLLVSYRIAHTRNHRPARRTVPREWLWTAAGGNASNSLCGPDGKLVGKIDWHKQLGFKMLVTGAVLGAHNQVYVIAGEPDIDFRNCSTLYAFNRKSGEELWHRGSCGVLTYEYYWNICSDPGGDRLLVQTTGNDLLCLDASTGDLLWNRQFGNYINSVPVIGCKGIAYMCIQPNVLCAIDIMQNKLLWQRTLPNSPVGKFALSTDESTLFVPADASTLRNVSQDCLLAVNTANGAMLWQHKGAVGTHLVAIGTGANSMLLNSPQMAQFDAQSGRMLGAVQAAFIPGNNVTMVDNVGRTYVYQEATQDIRAFSPVMGQQISVFKIPTGATVTTNMAVTSSGVVYFGTSSNELWCVDMLNSRKRWAIHLPNTPVTDISIGPGGEVYVHDSNGIFYKVT